MGDGRCLHIPQRIDPKTLTPFIRLNVGGSKIFVKCCPACHERMVNGFAVEGVHQNSGALRVKRFRRFPGDLARVWFEVQIR